MNRTLTALATLAMTTSPVMAYDSIPAHNQLLQQVSATGVSVKINPDVCDENSSAFGWYLAAKSELVICQENKITGSTQQVEWTPEDFDTIRHEAHHVTQDCRDGELQGTLAAVYNDPIKLAKEVLGQRHGRSIIESYKHRGAHIVVMELEAFSVASMNDPIEQVADIKTYCF